MYTKNGSMIFIVVLLATLTGCASAPTQIQSLATAPISIPTNTFVAEPTNTDISTNTPEAKTEILEESTSPDGKWVAFISLTIQNKDKYLDFKVSNKTTNQEWIIEQIIWNELQTPSSQVSFPYIFKWSQDNFHLYFSYEPNSNDGCFGYFRPGGFDLKRLNLLTGEIDVIRNGKVRWMALSPNEKKLAYIDTFGGSVSLLDVESGYVQAFPLPPIENEKRFLVDTKDLYWSPDGKSLIYAYIVGPCDLITPYTYVIQLFPDTNQQVVLVHQSQQYLIPIEWSVKDQILLKDFGNNHWWLNPTTKEIIRVP